MKKLATSKNLDALKYVLNDKCEQIYFILYEVMCKPIISNIFVLAKDYFGKLKPFLLDCETPSFNFQARILKHFHELN